MIDAELAYFHPKPDDDPQGTRVAEEALAAVAPVYAAAGIERLLLPRVIERRDISILSTRRCPARVSRLRGSRCRWRRLRPGWPRARSGGRWIGIFDARKRSVAMLLRANSLTSPSTATGRCKRSQRMCSRAPGGSHDRERHAYRRLVATGVGHNAVACQCSAMTPERGGYFTTVRTGAAAYLNAIRLPRVPRQQGSQ